MASENNFKVFGELTWRNYRGFIPRGEPDFLDLDEEQLIRRFVPILMRVVDRATSVQNPAFPAARYSVAGKVVPGAEWNDESRADLFVDLLTHLTKRSVESESDTGNQLSYIIGEASGKDNFVEIVSRLVFVHLRRVLRARLRQSTYGHVSELLIQELRAERFVVVDRGGKKFRGVVYGTAGMKDQRDFDPDGESFDRATVRFREMKRNKVSLKMLNPGGEESFPRWYDREELGRAAADIIEHVVSSAVSVDFLLRALQEAIQHLDMFEEGFSSVGEEAVEDEEFPAENPDFWSSDVRSDDLLNLYPLEDVGFVLDEVDEEVQELVMALKSRLDQVDRSILQSLHRAEGLGDEALGARLGVNAKTISRRRNGKINPLLDELRHRDPQSLLFALRVYLTDDGTFSG